MVLSWKIESFRAWLEGQAPDVIVGHSDSLESCPIATWQRETNERVSVSADTIVSMETGMEFEAPDWVNDFVYGIDERHGDEGVDEFDYRKEPVTAGECLEVIDQIV